MKCHYITDRIAGRILIPGCMSVVMSNDKRDCSCPRKKISGRSLRKEIRTLRERIIALELIAKTIGATQ